MPRLLTVVAVLLLAVPATAEAAQDIPPSVQLPAPAPTIADAVAAQAPHFLGVPYVWAGTTTSGFDCSGFTRFMYARFGITLDHSTYAQWDAGQHVDRSDLRPGDLVFFGLGHVGLYLGNGRFIHAPHTGTVVSIDSLDSGWYAPMYSGAVRVRGSQEPLKAPARMSARPAHRPGPSRAVRDQRVSLHALRGPLA
jgi:cell wall-associated NlpC family hydrolase